jgi:hypothetical protein
MIRSNLVLITLLGTTALCRGEAEAYFDERAHDFGAAPRGPQLVHYFRFTNNGKETLAISGVRVSCGCVTASAQATQVKSGEKSYIAVSMDTRRFSGHKAVTIYVQFTSPRYEEIALQVQANSRDDFSIYPETMAFGSVRKGSSSKSSVQVTLVGDPRWEVKGVSADSNYVKPSAKLVKRNGAEITFEISANLRPDLPVGKWYTDVWIETNNSSLAKVRIPLTVDVSPAITATPAIVELGDVKMGDSSEQNLLIKSDKPFKIKGVRGTDEELTITGIGDEAKAVHVLKIALAPRKEGAVVRSFEIVTDDSDEPAVTIPIRAMATKD